MSVMKRLTGIVQAKTNKALDRVEDPRETLDLSYEKQLEQLQQVKRGLADVATARKRIEIQAQQLQASANKLQDQASQALTQNREDLAREALSRREGIATQLAQLKVQHDQIASQEQHLITTSQQLQARTDAFRVQKETLKASYTAAKAQSSIGEAVSGISESMSDTGLAMQRAQDKISQMQARAGAVDELLASGALDDMTGSNDPLQAELDKGARSSGVELELARMKSQLSGSPTAAIAPASSPGSPAASDSDAEPADGEITSSTPAQSPSPAATPGDDLFSLDQGSAS